MMYALMDGVSMWVFVYFVALVLIGAIIVINLFLAVLCDNFEMADKDGEEKEETEDAEAQTQAAAKSIKHTNPIRRAVLSLVTYKYFDAFIQSLICLNTILMMIKWSPQ